jgi:hypothetical protein
MISGSRLIVIMAAYGEALPSICLVGLLPPVEGRSGHRAITASPNDIPDRFGVLNNRVATVGAEGISDLLIHIETSFGVRYSSS